LRLFEVLPQNLLSIYSKTGIRVGRNFEEIVILRESLFNLISFIRGR
jgi:hypothetical protein